MIERFIDHAEHGGCSKKVPALQLMSMLGSIGIDTSFSDSGEIEVGTTRFLSSIDVVLPMTLSPSDFGTIVVSHVFSDLYAAGGKPEFAMCVLGLPSGLDADDRDVVAMMSSAIAKIGDEGGVLLGGHTLADQSDLYLGFCVVGRPWNGTGLPHNGAKTGDSIVLTKPLGTSVASIRWKLHEADAADHQDVLDGMKLSNRDASKVLSNYKINSCTDVSGYGLVGHLHEMLKHSGVAGELYQNSLLSYPSIKDIWDPYKTQQFQNNRRYVDSIITGSMSPKEIDECHLFDAQVSGGLLYCVDKGKVDETLDALEACGYQPAVIGQVKSGRVGSIELKP